MYPYNKKLTGNAKTLRKNMTPEEKHLWYDFLKRLPITVHRQKCIGNYIVDFCIADKKIVIEIDGCQHGVPEHRVADEKRDSELRRFGITVLRYTNEDVRKRFNTVTADILDKLCLKWEDIE